MTALQKPDGAVRSIVVGEVFRRSVGLSPAIRRARSGANTSFPVRSFHPCRHGMCCTRCAGACQSRSKCHNFVHQWRWGIRFNFEKGDVSWPHGRATTARTTRNFNSPFHGFDLKGNCCLGSAPAVLLLCCLPQADIGRQEHCGIHHCLHAEGAFEIRKENFLGTVIVNSHASPSCDNVSLRCGKFLSRNRCVTHRTTSKVASEGV